MQKQTRLLSRPLPLTNHGMVPSMTGSVRPFIVHRGRTPLGLAPAKGVQLAMPRVWGGGGGPASLETGSGSPVHVKIFAMARNSMAVSITYFD
jgi:hypothetical protein